MDVGDVINGWRIVEDAGAGRSGHVFIDRMEFDANGDIKPVVMTE